MSWIIHIKVENIKNNNNTINIKIKNFTVKYKFQGISKNAIPPLFMLRGTEGLIGSLLFV